VNTIDLAGRTAVITGGAQGMGLAIATRLANSGAQISLWDRDAAFLEKAIKNFTKATNVHTKEVELTNSDSVQGAVGTVKDIFGSIDIFVNNAGIAGPTMPSWEYSIDDWLEVINIDLNAVYYCCRAVLPLMRKQNYGRIVNVASIAGKEGNPNAVAYSSAKAAVIALTKSISKETADKNIAVNCITPAAAKTRIFDQMSQEHIDYMLSKIPRGRFVLVEEVAAMVAWIVSEENSFTTGAVFDLSGGRATY
tara:strand:- start:565 stop:1317 length:753 start_codon:yes stop_codon:yes gene_type:complete